LIELARLEHNSRLAKLTKFMTHQILKNCYVLLPELSKVNRRDHDCYWNNIENTITLLDRSSEYENFVSY